MMTPWQRLPTSTHHACRAKHVQRKALPTIKLRKAHCTSQPCERSTWISSVDTRCQRTRSSYRPYRRHWGGRTTGSPTPWIRKLNRTEGPTETPTGAPLTFPPVAETERWRLSSHSWCTFRRTGQPPRTLHSHSPTAREAYLILQAPQSALSQCAWQHSHSGFVRSSIPTNHVATQCPK